jgi:endonuclease YncB( thermonuclease family)
VTLIRCFTLSLLTLLLLGTSLLGQNFTGRVVRVIDGDTISVLTDRTEVRIRLAECDAPESSQPFGYRAKQFTSSLVFGRDVTVIPQGTDRYHRTIAHIITDQSLDVSTELIRAGLAWWYRQYSRNADLGILERQAREAHRGLWSEPSPTPPWEWRRAR